MAPAGLISTPTAPLAALYLFPVFPTAEEFKRVTGTDAPPFDETKPIKTWADPAAVPGQFLTYATLVLGPAGLGGVIPYKYQAVYLDGEFAVKVNVPSERLLTSLQGHATVPVPMRELAAGESIRENPAMMGGPLVVNDALYSKQQDNALLASGRFLPADRALLQAIAAKLGV